MACSPAISLYAGRRASAIAGALFAFARAWRGRSDHDKKKAGQTSQARRKRRPLRSCHGSAGNRQKRTAETAPARSQAARWSQNPTDAHRAAHRASKRPKPGGEYPAEEAPRKTANTEPTEGQTDAAAETEAQDPTVEPPEPEGEALSLDSIDDLVLPGDVDPGEEQQSQRWRITDDALAPLSMDLLQSSASQIRVRTPSDAPSCGPEWPPERATAQGGGNGQPRQQSTRNGSHSSQRKRQEEPHGRSFSSRKMQKSKNMKKLRRSY